MMSYADPLPPIRDSFEAPARRRPWLTLLLVGGVICGAVVLAGVAVWLAAGAPLPGASADLPPAETREEKYAAVSAAFSRDMGPIEPARQRGITRLFDALVEALREGDREGFMAQVDAHRLHQLVLLEPNVAALSWYDKLTALEHVKQSIYVPFRAENCRIVHVDRGDDPDTAIVFAYVSTADGARSKMRWWAARGKGGWKAYDWELLDYGIRASAEQAIFFVHADNPRLQRYFDLMNEIEEVDRLAAEGEEEAAVETLQAAQQFGVPAELREDARLQVAHTWSRMGYTNEALRWYLKIQDPEAAPGALDGQAARYADRGQHEQALAAAARYEELLGADRGNNNLKARSLLALDRAEEAIVEFEKSLQADPDQVDTLQNFGLLLDADEKQSLGRFVSRHPDPVHAAVGLAEYFADWNDAAAVREMAELIGRRATDSP